MTVEAEFRTLENIPVEQICAAFNEAFSDYAVRADMPLGKFKAFLKSNGFEPSLSAGAFVDGALCAFVLNGVRDIDGVMTAYDSGTGVVPGLRRQGLTKGIFSLTFLNIDAGCGSMTGFLQSLCFEEYVGQYEMELDIKVKPKEGMV